MTKFNFPVASAIQLVSMKKPKQTSVATCSGIGAVRTGGLPQDIIEVRK